MAATQSSSKSSSSKSSTTSSTKTSTTSVGKNVSSLPTATVQKAVGAKVDGSYGPQTTASVKAFQTANGLKADGIVGPQTAAAITASLSKGTTTGATTGGTSKTTTGGGSTTAGGSVVDIKAKNLPGSSISMPSSVPSVKKESTNFLNTFLGKENLNQPSLDKITSGISSAFTNWLGIKKPAATPVPTQTPVVSTNLAETKAKEIGATATQNQKKIDEQKLRLEAERKAKELAAASVPPTPTPTPAPIPTPEEKLASLPADGMQKVYDVLTGEEKEIPEGPIPEGMTTQNPKTRSDVSDTVVDEYGNTIKKFSDGTYGRFDPQGNYTKTSEFTFTNTKRIQDISQKIMDAANGSYPLTPSQQGQLDATRNTYQDLIKQQQVENANIKGGTTLMVNRYGLGDQFVGAGIIDKVVSDGLNDVAILQNKMVEATSKMRQGFESDNIAMLKDAYTTFTSSEKKLQDNLDHIQDTIQKTKDKQDARNEANYYKQNGDYPDAGLLITDTPEERAKKIASSDSYKLKMSKLGVSSDAKDIASAIIMGLQPPTLTGLYRNAGPVRAELARQGYDLTKATQDWEATKKFIASSNSPQQLRMKQAEASVENTIPYLRQLNDEYNRSGFKWVNKVDLVASAGGVLGPEAAKKAQAILGQISLITDELGQTFMGGNSPTDAAFALAGNVLKGNFSHDVLDNQLNILEKNLEIRKNSWNTVGATSIGGGTNMYRGTSGGVSGTQQTVPLTANTVW